MSTLTTIQSTDLITNSRADINNNFSALNTDKIETSVLDTDTTLAANSDSKVATQKAVKAYVDGTSVFSISSETTTGATHSLTTTAGQRVIVWAKGNTVESGTTQNITLNYNGVTKDTVVHYDADSTANLKQPFALMYTETPGAATQNITVSTDNGTLANVVIIVQKFNV
jgi:hypothetical protein